ncbi:MAG: hypothetical protein L6R40_002822 [Gallowayella cf. fulva]|nr:MAG: hypothetical protein L6R40_002822 [Xanthomendoza cf. fulva]
MGDFQHFDNLFAFEPRFAYGEQTITKILKSRRLANKVLFIDRLLETLGLERPQQIYPPRSNQELRDLHDQIIQSASPDHHKQSVLYYLLKDIPDKDKAASTFAQRVFLPEKYRIFIDGIWLLDRGEFEHALEYLTEPVLIPTFPEEIVYILCTHLNQHDDKLPLAYYYTVSPAITSPKVLEALFSKLAASSVTEAFLWSRKQGEANHRKSFEQLVSTVFNGPEGEDRARRSVELIHLPFSEDEENWFAEFLTDGHGRDLHGAKEALAVRAIATGKKSAIATQAGGFRVQERPGLGLVQSWQQLRARLDVGTMK